MSVAIIDYGAGNLRSAEKAFLHVAKDQSVMVTSRAEDILAATHIVLPGVGAFEDCATGLRALPGMVEAMTERVIKQGQPMLGICVGMQLMCSLGHENGQHDGLGWIEGDVCPLVPAQEKLKIPHMGWNDISLTRPHPVTNGLNEAHMYFVHSYYAKLEKKEDTIATTDYAQIFPAIIGRDNIIGTQFHPEKSQRAGLHLLSNFLEWRP